MFIQPNDQGSEPITITMTRDRWQFILCGLKDCAARLEAEMAAEANPVDQEDIRMTIEDNRDVIELIETYL